MSVLVLYVFATTPPHHTPHRRSTKQKRLLVAPTPKAEKTCAGKEEVYAVAHKMEKYAAANPGDTTFDQYNELKEATATAKGAYEVAQGELAVAEEEKEYAVAQKKLEAYAAANPGDTTSAEYVGLETEQERADAAVKVVRANQAVLQAEKEREKAAKTCAEKEKKYAVAQVKLKEYTAANPSDTTSARYKELEEQGRAAWIAYVEMTCAEKAKESAVAQKKLEAYAAANPSDTTSARYVGLETEQERADAAHVAAQTEVKIVRANRALLQEEKERVMVKDYEAAEKDLTEYTAANPGDTTSDRYNKLKQAMAAADAKLNEHEVAVCRHTHVCVCHTLPDTGTQRSHCSPCCQGGGDGDPPA